MWSYETIDLTLLSLGMDLFINHKLIPISPQPCFLGECVKVYENAIRLQRYILAIHSCFSQDYKNNVHNEPAKILLLWNYVRQPTAAVFFKTVLNFQRQAVKDWNSHCNDVILSYNLGFVGVREDSSDGAALVILDMLLKFGVLTYNDNNTWALKWFAKLRRLYCFGDRKTIENSSALSWAIVLCCSRNQVFGPRFSSLHLTRSCSCQAIGIPVWICCNQFINYSGQTYWNHWGIYWDGRELQRMSVHVVSRHPDWWNIWTMAYHHILFVHSSWAAVKLMKSEW